MAQGREAVAGDKTQVACQLIELDGEIERLAHVENVLRNKLGCVLRDVEIPPKAEPSPEDDLVPLADCLRNSAKAVSAITVRIEFMLSALEL